MGPPEVSVNINIIIQVNHFNYLGLFTHMKAHHEPQYIKMMEQQELILNLRRERSPMMSDYGRSSFEAIADFARRQRGGGGGRSRDDSHDRDTK